MPEDVGTTRKVTTRVPENGYFYISTKEWLFVFVRMQPNLVFLWHKGRNFQAMSIMGDCRLAPPINFIRSILAAGNWTLLDWFLFSLVSVWCRCNAGDHVLGLGPLCSPLAYFTNVECVHGI